MDSRTLLDALIRAEHEDDVIDLLEKAGYPLDDDEIWCPLGDNAGNFSVVGNQQVDPAAALIEKVVNSIDAVLMGECFKKGIVPDSKGAPGNMQKAIELFFEVGGGRIDNLTPTEQTQLADSIHVIATGEKKSPCYCIVDRGEGQMPDSFPNTFLSTSRESPKIKIGFVQGKYNAGGSGSLQFCGKENIQLVVSRRQPHALPPNHVGVNPWGFTIVRRRRPKHGERSSVFVYLAPGGKVLQFEAESINVLPGGSSKNKPAPAYHQELEYGTAVKLYNYEWSGRGTATLEARRQLERVLHNPCLPFRITETRGYRANFYSTTVVGVWNNVSSQLSDSDESRTMETGFPATALISLRNIGNLPIRIGVWKTSVDRRNFPTGVFFLINGQVHGRFGGDFISQRLNFSYIQNHLIVNVDCTEIERSVAEDLFMASRDRLRRNEHYDEIRSALINELRDHQGLKDLNAARRKERFENSGEASSDITDLVSDLIRQDPGLAHLLGLGGKIVTSMGPGAAKPFEGRRFPTFFRLSKEPQKGLLKKYCPVNRTVKVEFETDAENEYFDRASEPGEIRVEPSLDLIEASKLWNGKFTVRFRVPWNANPGDVTNVRFLVSDTTRLAEGPFVSEFKLCATQPVQKQQPEPTPNPTPPNPHPNPHSEQLDPSLSMPKLKLVKKEEWSEDIGIEGAFDALRIKFAPEEGYDFYINVDCAWLLTELKSKKNEPELVKYWFTWGLALAALGMIRKSKNGSTQFDQTEYEQSDMNGSSSLNAIEYACDGLAQVIVPMFRVLHEGPPPIQ